MLALDLWRRGRCSGCGGDLDETTSIDNDGGPGAGAFVPLEPLRCHRCAAFSRSEKAYHEDAAPHSLHHRVEHRPPRVPKA